MTSDHCVGAPADFTLLDFPQQFAGRIGPIYKRENGRSITIFSRVAEHHTNPAGSAHGGFLVTLIDIAMGISVSRHMGLEGVAPTTQLNANFVGAAVIGDKLFCDVQVDRMTRTLAFLSGRIVAVGGTDERLVLTASAVFRNPPNVEQAIMAARSQRKGTQE
jgi:uncharacterized protein (TIGR00369 family)